MASTIEITDGVVETTSRMWLKKEMERFGEVDVCHMGNRNNPTEEPPWVRFTRPNSAESALAAIRAGQVFVDGLMVKADWRSSRKGPPAPTREQHSRRDLEVTSRDLFMEQRDRGGGGGGGGGGRNSKEDERKRSRSRERKRSRSRRRRRDRSRS